MSDCSICGGTGLIPGTAAGGLKTSRPCECQLEAAILGRLQRARIPAAFASASFEGYKATQHNRRAIEAAKAFCKGFIPGKRNGDRGLMFTGTVGTGKTHLAIAILRHLTAERGIQGRFVDIRELLDRLRSSYDEGATESHAQIFKPILEADLVVVDELGAARPSDWVFETIELLIGGLYNRLVPVIVTTNLPNLPAGGGLGDSGNGYARAARVETLGDRVGSRIFSRLQQMCAAIEMNGPDYRAGRKS